MFAEIKYPLEFQPFEPIAHRGLCGKTPPPENTLRAILETYKRGIRWIECDVKLTADGVVIVIHDDTLKRTTNAQAKAAETSIAEMTYAEIAEFDIESPLPHKFVGGKIPTLNQFLWLIHKLNMSIIVEIKPSKGLEIETARRTVEVLKLCHFLGYLRYSNVLIQSFFVECLKEVSRLDPRLHTGLLVYKEEAYTRLNTGLLRFPELAVYACKESLEDILRELNCTALIANHQILSQRQIARIKTETKTSLVFAWTIDEPGKAAELYNIGVNALISDRPERIKSVGLQNLFAAPASFFTSFEKAFLTKRRYESPELQELYDRECGLVLRR